MMHLKIRTGRIMTGGDDMTNVDRAELVDVTAQLAGAQKFLKHV